MSTNVAISLRVSTAEQLATSDAPLRQEETAQYITEGKRAVIYIRIPSPEQVHDGLSVTKHQHDACLAFCKRYGYEIIGTFCEIAQGRSLDDRPKLDEVRRMVREGHVDAVVVWDFSRLARRTSDLMVLAREAEQHHVNLLSVFLDVPQKDMSPLQAEAVTRERERISAIYAQIEKQESALPYGYQFETDGNGNRIIVPDSDTEHSIERLFK